MGSARLPGTRRLKNRRVIQSLFERPTGGDGVRVIRRGLVSARFRFLTPGHTSSGSGRSASASLDREGANAALPASGTQHFRFGVAVGRRTGNAVSRNAVKRILRERVRLRQAEIDRAVGGRVTGASSEGTWQEGRAGDVPILVMMLVCSGTADDAAQIHRDTDRAITALIEELSA